MVYLYHQREEERKMFVTIVKGSIVFGFIAMMLYVVIVSWYDEIQEWRAIAKKNKKERG